MQLIAKFALVGLFAASVVGCSGGKTDNAPGPEAKANKTYTKEDADRIKPKRAGSEGNEPPVDSGESKGR